MIIDAIIIVCLAIGLIFNALGVIGILRFPDV
jgi:multisubunit Na+/H+ antiporter MnhG subunit